MRKFADTFFRICEFSCKVWCQYHFYITCFSKRLNETYVSLADSRANGFVKWGDAHQPEKLGDARDGAGEGGVIAARVLAQGATTPGRTTASAQLRPKKTASKGFHSRHNFIGGE